MMSEYFDSQKFVTEAFELVFKNLTDVGKKYEKQISNNQVFQRFLIDFTIVIEQTIKIAVDKQETNEQIRKVTENMEEIKTRLTRLEPTKPASDDPMIN